jgi:hypothetical protein
MTIISKANRPEPGARAGTFTKPPAYALEDATGSARRAARGYCIAIFDRDPRIPGGKTSITIRYFHASGADRTPTHNYELFEVLEKGREPAKSRHSEADDRNEQSHPTTR